MLGSEVTRTRKSICVMHAGLANQQTDFTSPDFVHQCYNHTE